MTLGPRERLGPYEIIAALGAGGMGEVYRANDTKLGRDVALKILPASFTNDPERVARFRREAHVVASLNHPHVGQIYGLEEANGTQFLVLELVDGESLDKRIARGPIPVDEALGIARQIAEALEAAHEKGIIHRDLKPANVALTKDGQVKVLDFGLAKAVDTTSGGVEAMNSPTITSPAMMTGIGVILGTAAYMSPEQAKGRPADKRSDVWAFGCLLFEMLTSKRAFGGEDVADTLANVLKSEPQWNALPANTPSSIRRLLHRSLEKDRARRLADIADARLDVDEAVAVPEPVLAAGMRSATFHAPRRVLLVILGAFIFGGFFGWRLTRVGRETGSIARLSADVTPADYLALDTEVGGRPSTTAIALSPDGRTLVFSGSRGTTRQLWMRSLDQPTAAPLVGTEGAIAPFFSPDGRWIAFVASGKLKKIQAVGGPPIDICDVGSRHFGATWGSKDTIAFSTGNLILTVSASGGAPREVVKTDFAPVTNNSVTTPSWLPNESALLYTVRPSDDWTESRIVAKPSDGGAPHTLVTGGTDARYLATGHLVYLKLGTLVAVPFDPARLQITGAPVALVNDVMQAVNMRNEPSETGAGQFAAARAGTLAYVTGGIYPARMNQLLWVNRRGVEMPLKEPPAPILQPRVSPDGQRLTYAMAKVDSRETDIWVYDLARDVATRVTFVNDAAWPLWAPDGRHILFFGSDSKSSNRRDLRWISLDGSASSERVLAVESPTSFMPSSASSTGLLALMGRVSSSVSGNVWTVPLAGDRKPRLWLQSAFRALAPALSSDGRWVAYDSDESGRNEVYVQPYPGPGGKHRISRDGGASPVWARNGRELFYEAGTSSGETAMMAVDVDTRSGFHAGEPRMLFSGPYGSYRPLRGYDISADDQRFIMLKSVGDPVNHITAVQIVLNWTDELKARVPIK